MAKIRRNELKKFLTQLSKEELETEIGNLFEKYEQVQQHYTQDLGSDHDRQRLLLEYKEKMRKLFGTNRRLPLITAMKKIVNDYKKISIFPYELAQLMLYRIELSLELYQELGFLAIAFHNSTITAYEEVCELIRDNLLFTQFEKEMEQIICNKGRKTNYLGPDLVEVYNRYWEKPFAKKVKYHISYLNNFN